MSHLLFWPTTTFFYPVGNTSAVCLTENLPPESKADVLLLACGDPRHILYTVYVDEANPLTSSRVFDVTCCDVDATILARNTLLFTFLADDGALDKLDRMWDLFYHMLISQSTLAMLYEQCRKLIDLAESVQTWRAGPYGQLITTCDATTLAELRRVWAAYLETAGFSSKQARHFEQQFIDGMKEVSRRTQSKRAATAARSAGPLVLHAAESVARQFSSYWSSGITDNTGSLNNQKRCLTVNPTFALSIDGSKFAVHYATDPLSGFHLAEAFASGKFTGLHEHIPGGELVRVAKEQFCRWCTSLHRRLKNSNLSSRTFVIRMFAGDALMFSQALKYCQVMQSPITPYNVGAWRLSTIMLDHHHYGYGASSPAPLSFNVIDTSNILDHVGLVNVLVVTTPLLHRTTSATLYTEGLLKTGDDPCMAILDHVCGPLPIMALLLGIIPCTFMSKITSRSNVHETTMSESKQHYERLAWKTIGPQTQDNPDIVPTPPRRLSFSPEDLGPFLYSVYVQMFLDEDISSRFRLLSLSPERMLSELERSGVLHYNRRSFALFVHFVKTRVETDWWRTMDLFEDLVLADERLITGKHAYHELCCQLHLLGVYTTHWMSTPSFTRQILSKTDLGLFNDWTRRLIPRVVTLVLAVPRDAVAKLEPDFKDVGTPILQCDMQDGPRQLWFAVTSATFGRFSVSGTGENRSGVVIEGNANATGSRSAPTTRMQSPWRAKAPLIITFSVPATSILGFGENPRATVALTLRATMGVTSKFAERLGYNLTVFRTELANTERVFILARHPVMSSSMNVGRTVSEARPGHWGIEAVSPEQVSGSMDVPRQPSKAVHVKMNDDSATIQSFTVRTDITDPTARAVLANVQTIPIVSSNSGSVRSLNASLRIGTHSYAVQFPLPVDVTRARLRVARRSSYVEVVAPPASFEVRPQCDLSDRFTPLSNNYSSLALGSIHRVNLDCCPAFTLPQNLWTLNWFHVHLSEMCSELEKSRTGRRLEIMSQHQPHSRMERQALCGCAIFAHALRDTLLDVKQTLQLLLSSAANMSQYGQTTDRVFALSNTPRGAPYLYIIIACVRLDVGSHTVVADAFVAPGTPAVQAAVKTALHGLTTSGGHGHDQNPDSIGIRHIAADADEAVAWFHLLPHLTERCRAWPHRATCTYRSAKNDKHQLKSEEGSLAGTWEKQSPLCSCGEGVGTDVLPKYFQRVAPYLTRAAISPLFSVPYLEEVDVPIRGLTSAGIETLRKNSLKDETVDTSRTDATGVGYRCRSCGKDGSLTCSRCKRARYCSKECQRANWKVHKKDCGPSACGV